MTRELALIMGWMIMVGSAPWALLTVLRAYHAFCEGQKQAWKALLFAISLPSLGFIFVLSGLGVSSILLAVWLLLVLPLLMKWGEAQYRAVWGVPYSSEENGEQPYEKHKRIEERRWLLVVLICVFIIYSGIVIAGGWLGWKQASIESGVKALMGLGVIAIGLGIEFGRLWLANRFIEPLAIWKPSVFGSLYALPTGMSWQGTEGIVIGFGIYLLLLLRFILFVRKTVK